MGACMAVGHGTITARGARMELHHDMIMCDTVNHHDELEACVHARVLSQHFGKVLACTDSTHQARQYDA